MVKTNFCFLMSFIRLTTIFKTRKVIFFLITHTINIWHGNVKQFVRADKSRKKISAFFRHINIVLLMRFKSQ